jgi:histidinol dehydrogenase
MSVMSFERETYRRIAPHAVRLAELEGLAAHARSLKIRLTGGSGLDRKS